MLSRPLRDRAQLRPEVAAGVILRRWDSDCQAWLWLLLRNRRRGDWGMPKGHQEAAEDLRECALRECAEETGIALLALEDPPFELVYTLPSGRPKRVVYFPAETAQDNVTLSPEHNQFAWLDQRGVRKRLSHETLIRIFNAHLAQLAQLAQLHAADSLGAC
ncbi:MAG: NUDIX domain-containing protein [Planctomycetota bacterium]|nr:MAG: NUDIX domain-containing protein [Planctomycetota bacterium]